MKSSPCLSLGISHGGKIWGLSLARGGERGVEERRRWRRAAGQNTVAPSWILGCLLKGNENIFFRIGPWPMKLNSWSEYTLDITVDILWCPLAISIFLNMNTTGKKITAWMHFSHFISCVALSQVWLTLFIFYCMLLEKLMFHSITIFP